MDIFRRILNLRGEGKSPDEISAFLEHDFATRCACVTVDTTGFTRTVQKKGIAYFLTLLAIQREVINRELKQHPVLHYRFEADNIYMEFESVDDALKASIACRAIVDDSHLELSDHEPLGLCIGIGFGDLLNNGPDGVYGDEMNLSSKLGEDIADGGEILLSQNAYESLIDREKYSWSAHTSEQSKTSIRYYKLESV